jgi:micrococcal nuclease
MKRLALILGFLMSATLSCAEPASPTPATDVLESARETMTAEVSQVSPPTPTPDNHSNCVSRDAVVEVGLVSHIVDGDTIEAIVDGETFTVRYIGVDAPGLDNPDGQIDHFGLEAWAKNKELVEGKPIYLVKDVSDVDQDGCLLRYVFLDCDLDNGAFINYELARWGYARSASQAPDLACDVTLQQAQELAVQESLGLWAPTPVPTETPVPIIRPTEKEPKSPGCPCKRRP